MINVENDNCKILTNRLNINNINECEFFPKYFSIETVHSCNARCIFCTIDKWDKRNNTIMDMHLFKKFVDEVRQYKNWIETVCLNVDGEPTLDKDISKRVKMLKEVGIKKVTFSTNGQLLTPKLSENLMKSGLDDIMISFDSNKKEIYEKIRIGLNFEIVYKNIMDFIKIRNNFKFNTSIRLRMIINHLNKDEVNDWLTYWRKKTNKNDNVYAMPAHTWGNRDEKNNKLINKMKDIPCIAPFSTLAMHVDGKVGICTIDYNTEYFMGDFSNDTIKNIWYGEPFNSVRLAHILKNRNSYSICKGCNIWERKYEK